MAFGASYPYHLVFFIFNARFIDFQLKLGPEEKDTLRLNTITRNQRDLLALTVRCFHGRQYVINSALLQAVGLQTSKKMFS